MPVTLFLIQIMNLKEEMARGQQKIQSQQKNAERLAAQKKSQGGNDQKKAAQKALLFVCSVCKVCH